MSWALWLYGGPILLVSVIAGFGLAYDVGLLPRKQVRK